MFSSSTAASRANAATDGTDLPRSILERCAGSMPARRLTSRSEKPCAWRTVRSGGRSVVFCVRVDVVNVGTIYTRLRSAQTSSMLPLTGAQRKEPYDKETEDLA